MKPARILFFIDGHAPTPAEVKAASDLKANVVFRNARHVPSEAHSLELCDGVAGKVPKLYAEKFPAAQKAIADKAAALEALCKKVDDEKPPQKSSEPPKKSDPVNEKPPTAASPGSGWTANK